MTILQKRFSLQLIGQVTSKVKKNDKNEMAKFLILPLIDS